MMTAGHPEHQLAQRVSIDVAGPVREADFKPLAPGLWKTSRSVPELGICTALTLLIYGVA